MPQLAALVAHQDARTQVVDLERQVALLTDRCAGLQRELREQTVVSMVALARADRLQERLRIEITQQADQLKQEQAAERLAEYAQWIRAVELQMRALELGR